MKKTNNKGFSLVELIVVVLIMGILAVALTPQVLKWVNNSRKANDISLMQTVVSNCNTALASEKAYNEVKGTGVNIKIDKDGLTATQDFANFNKKLAEYCGYSTVAGLTGSDSIATKASDAVIYIEITADCIVNPTYTVDGNTVDVENDYAEGSAFTALTGTFAVPTATP